MNYRLTSFSTVIGTNSVYLQCKENNISDINLVSKLRTIVCSELPPSTIVHQVSLAMSPLVKALHFVFDTCPSTNNVDSKTGRGSPEILYHGTPAKYFTIGEIIATRRRRLEERKVAEELKIKAKVERELAREKNRALKAIKGKYRGEKSRKWALLKGSWLKQIR